MAPTPAHANAQHEQIVHKALPKVGILGAEDLKKFQDFFPEIVRQLTTLTDLEEMPEINERIQRILEYNVPHGKLLRAQLLIATAKNLAKQRQITESKEDREKLATLAWSIEMIQGSACIADDLVDRSDTRRGRPCWHRVDNMGVVAVNDGFILENLAYKLLELNFKDDPHYKDVLCLFHDIAVKALSGQSYDITNAGMGNYEKLTMKNYQTMMKFKNGFYTFYGPFVGGLLVNDIDDPVMLKKVENVTLDIGLLYSIQDDYMDCFVDESLTGKKGTDIADGKFSWPLVIALERVNEEQRTILLENYGHNEDEKNDRVKGIYLDLGIPDIYKEFEEKKVEQITNDIMNLPPIVPRHILHGLVDILLGRTC